MTLIQQANVLILCDEQDSRSRKSLLQHLTALLKSGRIQLVDLLAGEDRSRAINGLVRRADFILLLVTCRFIAMEGWERYLDLANCRTTVIPVLVEPVYIEGLRIARLKPLPTRGTVKWLERQEPGRGWSTVVKEFSKLLVSWHRTPEGDHTHPPAENIEEFHPPLASNLQENRQALLQPPPPAPNQSEAITTPPDVDDVVLSSFRNRVRILTTLANHLEEQHAQRDMRQRLNALLCQTFGWSATRSERIIHRLEHHPYRYLRETPGKRLELTDKALHEIARY